MAETFFRTAEMLKPQIQKIFYKPQASDELKNEGKLLDWS